MHCKERLPLAASLSDLGFEARWHLSHKICSSRQSADLHACCDWVDCSISYVVYTLRQRTTPKYPGEVGRVLPHQLVCAAIRVEMCPLLLFVINPCFVSCPSCPGIDHGQNRGRGYRSLWRCCSQRLGESGERSADGSPYNNHSCGRQLP